MKKCIILLASLFFAVDVYSQTITFAPQWTPQAQFAGFYMALEKGYYENEGLDVKIVHPGVNSTTSSVRMLLEGSAQIAGQQLIQAIVERSDGMPVVNVMQITQQSGLWCVSRNPISTPEEMNGMKIGRWKVGFSEFCDMLESYKGIKVNWVPFINGINLYVFGAVDATLCYSYSEFISLELAMGKIPESNILKFSDFGYVCPEDGLYVTKEYYDTHKDVIDRFVRASKMGWNYVRDHREEAVDLSLRYCRENHIETNRAHQSMMLDEYLRLQCDPQTGRVDYSKVAEPVFNDIVGALLNTGYITNWVQYNETIK